MLNKKTKQEKEKKVISTWRMINTLQKWLIAAWHGKKMFFFHIEYSLRPEINIVAVQLEFGIEWSDFLI
jgi:hypothetical protein